MTENPYEKESDIQYRDKLDTQFTFNRHLDRCLQLVGHPAFPNSLEALAKLLPGTAQLTLRKRNGEWVPIIKDFEYSSSGPIRLGTKKKPLMEKMGYMSKRYPTPYVEDEDGNKVIDWDDPHIISPQLVEKEDPDYMLYLGLILEEAENSGLTWNIETYSEIVKTKPAKAWKNPTRKPQQ